MEIMYAVLIVAVLLFFFGIRIVRPTQRALSNDQDVKDDLERVYVCCGGVGARGRSLSQPVRILVKRRDRREACRCPVSLRRTRI